MRRCLLLLVAALVFSVVTAAKCGLEKLNVVNAQNVKVVPVIVPAAIVDNASFTAVELDTKGFEYCQVYVMLGATDIAMAALKMQESAAAGSGQADITGLVFGTSVNTAGTTSALPTSDDDSDVFCFDIDLKARQRYLTLVATAGNGSLGTFACAWAVLSRGHATPMSATQRGLNQCLRV